MGTEKSDVLLTTNTEEGFFTENQEEDVIALSESELDDILSDADVIPSDDDLISAAILNEDVTLDSLSDSEKNILIDSPKESGIDNDFNGIEKGSGYFEDTSESVSLSEEELDNILDNVDISGNENVEYIEKTLDTDFKEDGIFDENHDINSSSSRLEYVSALEPEVAKSNGEILVIDGFELNRRLGDQFTDEKVSEPQEVINEFTIKTDSTITESPASDLPPYEVPELITEGIIDTAIPEEKIEVIDDKTDYLPEEQLISSDLKDEEIALEDTLPVEITVPEEAIDFDDTVKGFEEFPKIEEEHIELDIDDSLITDDNLIDVSIDETEAEKIGIDETDIFGNDVEMRSEELIENVDIDTIDKDKSDKILEQEAVKAFSEEELYIEEELSPELLDIEEANMSAFEVKDDILEADSIDNVFIEETLVDVPEETGIEITDATEEVEKAGEIVEEVIEVPADVSMEEEFAHEVVIKPAIEESELESEETLFDEFPAVEPFDEGLGQPEAIIVDEQLDIEGVDILEPVRAESQEIIETVDVEVEKADDFSYEEEITPSFEAADSSELPVMDIPVEEAPVLSVTPEIESVREEPQVIEKVPVSESIEQPLSEKKKHDEGMISISKGELKEILLYIDNLFGDLPEDKIKDFAKSKYYDLYNKVFDDLGI